MEALFAELTMNGWSIRDLASGVLTTDAINLGQLNAIFSSNNTWSGTQTWQNVSEFTYQPVTGITTNHSIGVRGVPFAQATGGLLEIGAVTSFDGSTSGFFSGSGSGTYIALNAASGFAGNLLDIRVANTQVFQVSGSGLAAFGADVDSNTTLQVTKSITTGSLRAFRATLNVNGANSNFPVAGAFQATINAGAGIIGQVITGGDYSVNIAAGQSGSVNAVYGQNAAVTYSGTGGATALIPQRIAVDLTAGSGTIANVVGMQFALSSQSANSSPVTNVRLINMVGVALNASGTMGSFMYIDIENFSGTQPVTTMYGIRIRDLSKGATNYAIYFDGTSGLARQGIWWNGDTNLYRGAADLLKTDDKFQSMNRFLLGLDMSFIPVASGQSVLTSWHALQLKGNFRSTVDHTPANVGGINDASVIIPNQLNTAVGLIVYGAASQSGDLQQWRANGGGSALIAITAAGLLKLSSQALATAVAGQFEYDGSLNFTDSTGRAKVKLRATVPITFMVGFTPSGTGADKVFKVPRVNGASVTFNVRRLFWRVETPSAGSSSIRVEKYTGTGAFSATNMMTGGDLTLTGGSTYQATHTTFSTTQLTSDDKVRINVVTLDGTHADWLVELELEEV